MHVLGGRDENINFLFFWTVDLFLLSSKWVFWKIYLHQGSFPGGSGGKESTYNVGDPGSIPGSGSSLGEGNDSPLQYSCLEKSHGWRNLVDCKESDRLSDFTFTFIFIKNEGCSVVSDSLRPHGLYSPWNSPGQNIGVCILSLVQGIFLTQGSNPGLLHCRQILYQLSHKGCPPTLLLFFYCNGSLICPPWSYGCRWTDYIIFMSICWMKSSNKKLQMLLLL